MKIVATLPPMHPGEMLPEEFLKPLGLSPFGTAAGFWLNLQKGHDLPVAERAIAKELAAIEVNKQEAA